MPDSSSRDVSKMSGGRIGSKTFSTSNERRQLRGAVMLPACVSGEPARLPTLNGKTQQPFRSGDGLFALRLRVTRFADCDERRLGTFSYFESRIGIAFCTLFIPHTLPSASLRIHRRPKGRLATEHKESVASRQTWAEPDHSKLR